MKRKGQQKTLFNGYGDEFNPRPKKWKQRKDPVNYRVYVDFEYRSLAELQIEDDKAIEVLIGTHSFHEHD